MTSKKKPAKAAQRTTKKSSKPAAKTPPKTKAAAKAKPKSSPPAERKTRRSAKPAAPATPGRPAYIFYDVETTGLNNKYDQIVQFAAVVTDDAFNVIDTIDVKSRRLPWVIPSHAALHITGLKPEELDERSMSEYRMIRQVFDFIDKYSPAEIIGYNSLPFDQKFMRQSLYLNGLERFLLNYHKGNKHGDLLNIVHAVKHHRPDKLRIKMDRNNKRSYKLLDVCNENGIDFEASTAHDALPDVIATVKLAKLLHDRAPDIWQRMKQNMVRDQVQHLMQTSPLYCLTETFFMRPKSYPVTTISSNPVNDRQFAVFDLSYEVEPYLEMEVEDLVKLLSGGKRLGLRLVRSHYQPIVLPFEDSPAAYKGDWPEEKELRRRAQLLQHNYDFHRKVEQALELISSPEKSLDHVAQKQKELNKERTKIRRQLKTVTQNIEKVKTEQEKPRLSQQKITGLNRRLGGYRSRRTVLQLELAQRNEVAQWVEASIAAIRKGDVGAFQAAREPYKRIKDNPVLREWRDWLDIAHKTNYPRQPYLEEKLYDEGFGTWDKKRLHAFHGYADQGEWQKAVQLINRVDDKRAGFIMMRVIYDNAPEALPKKLLERMEKYVYKRVRTTKPVPWDTYPKLVEEITKRQFEIDTEKSVCKAKGKSVPKALLAEEKELKWNLLYAKRTFGTEPIGSKPVPKVQKEAFKSRGRRKALVEEAKRLGLDTSPLSLMRNADNRPTLVMPEVPEALYTKTPPLPNHKPPSAPKPR